MKFGVREICEVVLRAKSRMEIGSRTFYRNEPVIYFDTLTASSLEGAATTVYATGGRGNTRLMAWEGERTMTFNMTDALMSPEGFMILSGAGLIEASEAAPIYVHTTSQVEVLEKNKIILPELACWNHSGEMLNTNTATLVDGTNGGDGAKIVPGKDYYHKGADIFIMVLTDGEIEGEPCIPAEDGVKFYKKGNGNTVNPSYEASTEITCYNHGQGLNVGDIVLVDYYVKRTSGVKQIEITPDKFGGYFYLEASTLFRRESDGKDLPAEFIIPKCKVQSNFTFSMASNGDPSTFDFVLDAFPDYTKFDGTKKVLAALQVVESAKDTDEDDNASREHCVAPSESGETEAQFKARFDHKDTYGEYSFADSYAYSNDDKASAAKATKTMAQVKSGSGD